MSSDQAPQFHRVEVGGPASRAPRRYLTAAERAEALALSDRVGVAEAARRTGVSRSCLYNLRSGRRKTQAAEEAAEADPAPVLGSAGSLAVCFALESGRTLRIEAAGDADIEPGWAARLLLALAAP
jgi:transposase-like protein